jgi:hypothetical protein
MELKAIVEKSRILSKELGRPDARRNVWNTTTKDLIFNALSKIKGETALEWFVQENNLIAHHEAVYLKLANTHSGIVIEENDGNKTTIKGFIKHGGYLLYAQHVNGRISVLISYPHVDEFVVESEHKKIGYYDPEEITEELIYSHVGNFLDEIIAWESADLKQPPAFKVPLPVD